jgi:ABC-type phosphate transport system substrate-binding protein
MKRINGIHVFLMIVVTAFVAGCSAGSGSSPSQTTNTTPAQTGSVYVLGTDAPLPSVVSFAVGFPMAPQHPFPY